jgi:signal transduction histidine kinase
MGKEERHGLKNKLQLILGYAELLSRSLEGDKDRKAIKIIKQAAKDCINITNEATLRG